jgi:hypothetical protein
MNSKQETSLTSYEIDLHTKNTRSAYLNLFWSLAHPAAYPDSEFGCLQGPIPLRSASSAQLELTQAQVWLASPGFLAPTSAGIA